MVEVDRGIMARDTYVSRTPEEAVQELEAGSVGEAVGGAAALVLAILGLIGILPQTLAAIGAIAVGAALLLGGGALAGQYSRIVTTRAPTRARQEIAGALGFQALAGAAGIVLGILALLGVQSVLLLAIAALVFGVALVAAGSGMARLAQSARWLRGDPARPREAESIDTAGGWEGLIGISAVVLGILALTGHASLTLVLVAMLSVGAAILFAGSLVAARLFSFFG